MVLVVLVVRVKDLTIIGQMVLMVGVVLLVNALTLVVLEQMEEKEVEVEILQKQERMENQVLIQDLEVLLEEQ